MPGVQAGYTYNPDSSEVPVRAWAEESSGDLSTEDLDLSGSFVELWNESGVLLAVATGQSDPAGSDHALFRMNPVTLVAGKHYLMVVALRTLAGDAIGPRTFGLPVN